MSGTFGENSLNFFSGTKDFYSHKIGQSLRFDDGDSAQLVRTPSSSGNTQTFTYSGWIKRGNVGNLSYPMTLLSAGPTGSSGTDSFSIFYTATPTDDYLRVQEYSGGGFQLELETSAFYRDPSAWYNVVVSVDTTNSTADDRVKIYINGEEVTSFGDRANPSLNFNTNVNSTTAHSVGDNSGTYTWYFDGYMAEINLIDGTALDASSFGETKAGIWIPKDTSGLTFGTNGFRLKFQDSSALGDDTSGNGNDFSVTNLAATDVVLDSPTNNWATMNPLDGNGPTIQEGNLKVYGDTSFSVFEGFKGTFPMSSGKWYWEVYIDVGGFTQTGITPTTNTAVISTTNLSYHTDAMTYESNGNKAIGTGGTGTAPSGRTTTSYGASYTDGDIIGVALDLDSSPTTLTFYKNNSTQGAAFSSLASDEYVAVHAGIQNNFGIFNFGQDSSFAGTKTAQGNTDDNGVGDFYYSPPSGYLACCSANLPDPAIDPAQDEEPADHFNTVLYAGNNSTNNITGVGFQPDWVWLKNRSSGSTAHRLYDSVRGPHKALFSTSTTAEFTEGGWGLDSFDSDGFTLLHDNTNKLYFNQTGQNYVAWNWLAGGSASSNSDGDITSSVSANTKAGFSIVSYTGTASADTVGHGLSQAPELVIWKDRETAVNWLVQGDAMGAAASGYIMLLNNTGSSYANSNFNTTLGASTITLDAGGTNYNGSGKDTIAYCFHSVDGFSKIGKYFATNSSNGPFVHLGFRPALVIIKATNRTSHWIMQDNKRPGYNQTSIALFSNLSNAESTDRHMDFLSNGFKLRLTALDPNTNTAEYIYLAFAEQPFKYSNAR
jgi:hypothetical protein